MTEEMKFQNALRVAVDRLNEMEAELTKQRAEIEQVQRAHERLRCYHVAYAARCPGCELRRALSPSNTNTRERSRPINRT